MMSANITAASTPWRRTGCSVTSAQSSGVCATSQKECRSRIARYSGSERPAWRMNQTGVRSTGSRRAARTRSGSMAVRLASRVEGTSRRPLGRAAAPAPQAGHDRAGAASSSRTPARSPGATGSSSPTTGSTTATTRSSGTASRTRAPPLAPGERAVGRGARPRADPARPLPARLRPGRRAARLVLGARQPDARRRTSRSRRATASRTPTLPAGRRAGAGLGGARARRARRGLRRRRRRDRLARRRCCTAARASSRRTRPAPGRVPGFTVAAALPVGAARDRAGAARRVAGLPAFAAPRDEPWVYDGRIVRAA